MAERKVPLINVTRVDMKGATAALNRIADALEIYLQIAHNYHMRKPAFVPDEGDNKSSLDYYTDLEAVKQEVEQAMKGAPDDEGVVEDV